MQHVNLTATSKDGKSFSFSADPQTALTQLKTLLQKEGVTKTFMSHPECSEEELWQIFKNKGWSF